MITKIYVVRYDNGAYDDEKQIQSNFKYCYKTKEEAKKAIEELSQDKTFLIEKSYCKEEPITENNFWIEELELV